MNTRSMPTRPGGVSRRSAAVLCGSIAVLFGLTAGLAACAEQRAEGSEPVPDEPSTPLAPAEPIAEYLQRAIPDSVEVEAAFEQLEEGLRAWSTGDHREGAHAVDAALSRLPTVGDWRPLVRAELLAADGDTAGVRAALDELDPATDFAARWGWEFLVRAHEEADDPEGARRIAEEVAASDWIRGSSASAWLRAGRLALAADDSTGAGSALRASIRAGDGNASARAAARLLDEVAEPEDTDDLVHLGRTLLAGGQWERAERRLAPLLETDLLPEREEAEIRLGLGRGLVELNRPRDAERILAPLIGEAVPPELAGPALFWTGRAALARRDVGSARARFLEVAQRSPSSALAEEGLLMILDFEADRGGPAATAAVIDAILEVGVRSTSGELAAVRFGTEKYLAGDYEAAAGTFERYLAAGRRATTRQQAAYWAALAHERRGENGLARELLLASYEEDPLSFYGTFAADRLDAPVLPADLPAGPGPVPGISDELVNAIIRLRVHQRVPTSGSFDYDLQRLQEHFFRRGDAAYDFAEALLDRGFPVQSMVLGREIHRREGEWNLRLLWIVFPFPYREAVVREARARGLDPFFVAGLIRQESMFHPTIRSGAGAVGLMQLMPATARAVARSEGIRFTNAVLEDPDTNVRLGTAFLASMVRRFDGRAEDALSAYNAGPTRARQWQGRDEYRDTDVFLEHIPFRETRHYVKVVQQYTRIYTALYGCGLFQPCLGLSYRAAVEASAVAGGAPSSSLAR